MDIDEALALNSNYLSDNLYTEGLVTYSTTPELERAIFLLKQEHHTLFVYEVGGETFIFRPMSKAEFAQILGKSRVDEVMLSETVCELCVLWPEGYDFENCEPAGLTERLSDEIIEKSCFGDEERLSELVFHYRQEQERDNTQVENTILVAFPSITPQQLKHMTAYEIADYYSRAEWVVNNMMAGHQMPQQEQEMPPQADGRQIARERTGGTQVPRS